MLPLKISKKHHKHLNNPFPSPPKTLPFIHGTLSFNPSKLPQRHTFPIGEDFQLSWSSRNGGYLSISHQSQPKRSIWSTIPGEAFISAAAAQTEVEESRGSFVVKDGDALFISNHQSIDEIRPFHQSDIQRKGKDHEILSGFLESSSKTHPSDPLKGTHFPILLITGWVFCKKRSRKSIHGSLDSGTKKLRLALPGNPSLAARYWVVLDQKNSNQIGFHVKFGELVRQWSPIASPRAPRSFQIPRWKLLRFRRRRFARSSSTRDFLALSSEDESEEGTPGVLTGLNRVIITYSSERDEKFYGFGEQFSHVEFKGKRVPILVQEQGIGRGDQPITFAANLISYRSGGDWSTTYAPSPFYFTSKMRSLYLEGYNYSVFDLTKHDRVQIQIHGNSAQGRILNGNSPTELIERFTETIGRPPMLPNWIISGAIVGMQGGTETVRRVWDQLKAYDVPVSAFWLQDWVGQRETIIGSQLWWNWEVDNIRYAGWRELVKDLRSHNIRVMTYCNPCLVPTNEKPNRKKDLFEEAKSLDILVKDSNGSAYMIPNTAFDVAMLDLTHPEASNWFKKILHEMVDCGVRGWMADFGEGLPLDANLFSGEDPVAAHNRYPELWARVNREFVDDWKSNTHGKEREDPEESLVFFMRAGFRDSPRWAMLFWEGDQMVSWQKNDGIKSSITGLLSSGLSGFPFNHSDIGGYCAVNLPVIKYQRSEELLMRWMELNAFSLVFRTHEYPQEAGAKSAATMLKGTFAIRGNAAIMSADFASHSHGRYRPIPRVKILLEMEVVSQRIKPINKSHLRAVGNKPSSNYQFYSNRSTLSHFARFAKVYQAWRFYRIQLVKEAAEKGLPVARHLFLHYPDDEHVHSLSYQQFLVGTEILVVPVLDKGKKGVRAYFPLSRGCSWQHLWSGKVFSRPLGYVGHNQQGFEAWVEAPIGYPAVFLKLGSPVGETFVKNLKDLKIL